ncbi:MAG: aldolase [Candidatus Syntropharchaeia archaeon]
MWKEISKFGKKLVENGFVTSHFGNISVRIGNKILITRSGTMLEEIDEDDVVEIDLDRITSFDLIASSEAIVHREIYKKTSALAIIHAHCVFSVIESLLMDEGSIKPIDSEGIYFLHEIPIVKGGVGTEELATNAAEALRDHKGVIIHGHGTIAVGKILEEAYVVTAMMEHSCKIRYYHRLAKFLSIPRSPQCTSDF